MLTGGGLPEHLGPLLGVSILNGAHAGDSSEQVMGLRRRQWLEEQLPGTHILLVTFGGDDFAGDQFVIVINPNTDGDLAKAVNWERFEAILDLIVEDYEDLLELRDQLAPNCWVITQSYDFPVAAQMGVGAEPLGIPVGLGPWLQPGLAHRGWTDPEAQAAIVRQILLRFQARLAALAASHRNHLHVNTQGTLSPEDWQNEIHPKASGWLKLARRINLALLPVLDRIKP
jgi:hypothetical protein